MQQRHQPDWPVLVDALSAYGVRYLSGASGDSGAAGEPVQMDPLDLLMYLAQSPEPHLRQALAALFLVHPELATIATQAAGTLPPASRDVLIESYVAAIYLQRFWRTRLRRYLGDQPTLPPLWVEDLGLPAADDHYGKLGLTTLEARRSGRAHRRSSAYERVALHLFGQLQAERALFQRATAA